MKRNRKLLEEHFPAAYIAAGLNATKAYKTLKKPATYMTARVEGSKLLANPRIQEKIRELLADQGLTAERVIAIHKRNLEQSRNLSVSQTAVQDAYKLYGAFPKGDDKPQVQIGLIIER